MLAEEPERLAASKLAVDIVLDLLWDEISLRWCSEVAQIFACFLVEVVRAFGHSIAGDIGHREPKLVFI